MRANGHAIAEGRVQPAAERHTDAGKRLCIIFSRRDDKRPPQTIAIDELRLELGDWPGRGINFNAYDPLFTSCDQ